MDHTEFGLLLIVLGGIALWFAAIVGLLWISPLIGIPALVISFGGFMMIRSGDDNG